LNELTLILGMALVTFAVRYPVLALFGRIPLPQPIFRALRFVPAAVLAAIVAPAMLVPGGTRLELHPANAALVAGLVAGLVAWRSRNLLWTILVGMAFFWFWRWLMGSFGF
jgi:branched-subunit amino acid transport protein